MDADLERSRRLVLPELGGRSARRSPDRVALAFAGERRTFAQLDERVSRAANAFAGLGVRAGDNVAVMMHNRIELLEACLGAQRLGACAVPINFRLAQDEVDHAVANARCVAIVSDPPCAERAGAAGARVHLDLDALHAALAAASPEPPGAVVDDEDLAFIIHTSGTTGRPKGAMLTHQNLVVNTTNWVHEVGATRDDVWLSGLPLFHIGGLNGVLPFLYLGATSVITPSTGFDAGGSIALMAEHGVTMCFFVPTQWDEICAHPRLGELDAGRLRVAMWGASDATEPTLRRLAAAFPSVSVVNAFGQTEMSSNTTFLKGPDAVRRMGSIGRPAINVEVRIVDEAGDDVAPGDVGEIVYRGPTVMRGYYGDPAATAEAFAGGWFHSGDLVRADPDGFLSVVGRAKDMIISGGENVYPAEVERVLAEHPAVAEVAVVGVAHPRWVETPLAVVVTQAAAEVTEAELVEHCRTRLAGYKKPSAVVFADALPRNATGKVLRRELRERYGR
jgi:acyl-CoA synthetase (AMP-forming)/AMP-acid ligase II